MKILMIDYEYAPLGGGGGVFNRQLAEELSNRHEVTVITSQFDQMPREEMINHVRVRRVPVVGRVDRNVASLISLFAFFPASLNAGFQLLKREKYDIIHSFFFFFLAHPGIILSNLFKLPHLVSLLGGDIYDPSKFLSPHRFPLLKQTVTKIIKDSDKVISLSNDIKEKVYQYFNVDCPIDVIHLGIPKPQFPPINRSDIGILPDHKVLITVGRLVERKGVDALIFIVKELADPEIRLLIVGDGPKRLELEKCAIESGVKDQIRFMGNVSDDDKFGLLNIADAYVSTSVHEGFGIVFLEAMAAHLPVISYDHGGQKDFLINGKTGFIVPLGMKDKLKEAIRLVLSDNLLRNEIKEYNRHYVKRFYIDQCAKDYERQYQKLISS